MPKRLKGRPTAGAAYVPFIAAGGWSLLALSIWIAGSGAWTSTVSLCLGAVAAWACFRPSEDGDQSHGAWKVLGAGIVAQCIWLALEASGADWWHQRAESSEMLGPLDTVGWHCLTLCFYHLALAHSRRGQLLPTALLRLEMGWAGLAYGSLVLLLLPSWRWRVAEPVWNWLPVVCAVLVASGGAVLALELLRRSLPSEPGRKTTGWLSAAALANAAQLGLATLAREWPSPTWMSMDGPPAAVHLLAAASWAAAGVAASGSRLIRRQRPPRDSAGTTGPGTALLCLACVALAAVPLLETLPAGTRPGPSQQQLHQLLFAGMLAALGVLLVTRVALVERIHRQRLRRVRQESARSHFMLDSINDGIVTEDLAGRIQFANQQFYHLFGIRPSDAVHYHFEDFIHPEDRGQVRAQYQQAVEARRDGLRIEFRGVRSDGTTLWLEGQVTPIESGGILLGRQSVLRDISRQRLIETSQRAMAQRLEFFVNKMPLGCIIWDLDFRVQEWNESAERIFGWSQSEVFRVRYVDFLVPPEDRTALEAEWRKLRESKTSGQFQCQNLTKHRGKIECEWHHTSLVDESGRVVAVASMVQDVTERKSLELQLVQSQKLEAVGTLAGGIAHDFNNLLTTILGHISLALMKLGPRHQAARGLRDAETAAERAAELTQQLLRFSRKTPVELKPIDLNQSLETVIGLLQHSIDRETDLEVSLAPQLWAVEADRGQIEQVIMNLCVNARDAIEEGGRIRVHSANRFVDETYCRTHAQGRVGEFVEFGVSDTGCGMDEATRARVFEPFFTTKEVGKGTGLGLAMVYGIVKDHRGWVEVQSDQGRGSAFRVFLPRTHRALVSEAKALLPRLHHGVETVLLAEDEEAVRKLGLEILERHGHSVLEARDGQEAIDLFRRHRDQIGLVVLDLTMPRRTGWEAFHEVRRLKPDVPVILSSGYSLEAGPQAARQFGAEAFLPKPYKAQQLLTLVQKVLDAEHSLKGGP